MNFECPKYAELNCTFCFLDIRTKRGPKGFRSVVPFVGNFSVHALNFLTHVDSNQNLSRSRIYLNLNMHDFWKFVSFNRNFYHPYFCVSKQGVNNMNPSYCAWVRSRSQLSNAPGFEYKFFPVTDISWLEHTRFLGIRDFEQKFLQSLFAHERAVCAWYGSESLCVEQ